MRKLLFFHAPWCYPCRHMEKSMILPLQERFGKEKVVCINAQTDPFAAEKYHVDKLPTVILLDGETVHMNRTGAIDMSETADWLKGGDAI